MPQDIHTLHMPQDIHTLYTHEMHTYAGATENSLPYVHVSLSRNYGLVPLSATLLPSTVLCLLWLELPRSLFSV